MKLRSVLVVGLLGVVALVVAACGSSNSDNSTTSAASSSPPASQSASPSSGGATSTSGATTVSARRDRLGTILVDNRGRTLYMWVADRGGRSVCMGSCAQGWPPLTTAGMPRAAGGVQANLLSTVRRSDGTMQVTYDRKPLYYFAGDSAAGDVNGQARDDFGADWFVVGTNGRQIATGDADSGSSDSSDSDSDSGAASSGSSSSSSSSDSSGGDAAGGGWG